MFTGLVESTGRIVERAVRKDAALLRIECARAFLKVGVGDSVAVNGCCLTAVAVRPWKKGALIEFNLLAETWRLTNFQHLAMGAKVNLERSLCAGSPVGGHFVTGHIDGLGVISRWELQGADYRLEIVPPPGCEKYLLPKGSVAVDGISLTVADVGRHGFGAWIIPHTHRVTNLSQRQTGGRVNLEFDMLGKYVVRAAERMLAEAKRPGRRRR